MLDTASRLLARPEWLVNHARLYGALAQTEAEIATRQLTRRVLAVLLALAGAAVALNLAGLALLLLAGRAGGQMDWLFWAVPAVPALLAVGAAWVACRPAPVAFAALREQLAADAGWLQQLHTGEARHEPQA